MGRRWRSKRWRMKRRLKKEVVRSLQERVRSATPQEGGLKGRRGLKWKALGQAHRQPPVLQEVEVEKEVEKGEVSGKRHLHPLTTLAKEAC